MKDTVGYILIIMGGLAFTLVSAGIGFLGVEEMAANGEFLIGFGWLVSRRLLGFAAGAVFVLLGLILLGYGRGSGADDDQVP